MSPAFSSTKEAGAFALLLLALLLSPLIVGKSILPPREHIYSAVPWATTGPYPYIHQQIFEEKDDIDIAFVGSSHLLQGIDTPYIQKKLSEELGRPAVVRTLAWGGSGYDAQYFITQDLLQNRKVRMLVFYDDYHPANMANSLAPRWFRWGDNADDLTGMPLRAKASYYFASILGMPQNFLGLLRSNLPADFTKMKHGVDMYQAPSPAARLGSLAVRVGFSQNFTITNPAPFSEYTPQTSVQSSDACVYSAATKSKFQFTGPTTPSWQLSFARKAAALAKEYHSKIVYLNIPTTAEIGSPVIREREYWPDALQADVTMVGIPPATLFEGIKAQDVYKLFSDPAHLNKNGQEYFTSLITPSLLKIYDSEAKR